MSLSRIYWISSIFLASKKLEFRLDWWQTALSRKPDIFINWCLWLLWGSYRYEKPDKWRELPTWNIHYPEIAWSISKEPQERLHVFLQGNSWRQRSTTKWNRSCPWASFIHRECCIIFKRDLVSVIPVDRTSTGVLTTLRPVLVLCLFCLLIWSL